MPDNVDITPGVGATIAADDVGGILHQRVKIESAKNSFDTGIDGTAVDLVGRASDWGGDYLLMVNANVMANNFRLIGPTQVAAQTYSVGDVIGGVQTFTNAVLDQCPAPFVDSVCVVDDDNVGPDLEIIFSGNYVGTGADGVAHGWAAAGANFGGVVSLKIAAADWQTYGSTKVVTKYPGFRIPQCYGAFQVACIARSSYTLTADNFYLSVCIDHS